MPNTTPHCSVSYHELQGPKLETFAAGTLTGIYGNAGTFTTPPVLKALLDKGHLGQKTKAGFFKKQGRDVLRFDLARNDYVPAGQKADEVYGRMLKKPAAERRPPEFGSDKDFQLQQALNQLKGLTVLASKTQTERPAEKQEK